jgi:hypothetical protein
MLSATGIVGRIRKEHWEERLLPFPVTGFGLAEANFSREVGKSIRHCKFAGDLISGCMLIFRKIGWILFLMRGITD